MPNTDDLDRTLFISDNLPFLQSLDTESVDLIVIDPPFGKNQTFVGNLRPPLTDAELENEYDLLSEWGIQNEDDAYDVGVEFPDQSGTTAQFRDIWDFRYQITQGDWDRLDRVCPAGRHLIETTRYTHSESTAAYIAFMTMRMLEIRRILKPTGSVYLHCDHSANAYLRQMMDAVFGSNSFRNEIVWKRTVRGFKGSQYAPRNFSANTDSILFYGKTRAAFFDMSKVLEPYQEDYLESAFNLEDDTGPYYLDVAHNRPSASPRPNLRYEYRGINPPHPSGWKVGRKRMEELDRNGDLVLRHGELFRKIRPRGGRIRNQLWDDISEVKGSERTGYPTQKPQALARRIIEASSNPGDLVLDCFAGCAYVPVAAELADRRWIACDMSPRAWTVIRRQFHKQPNLRVVTEGEIERPSEIVENPAGPEHYREGESVKVSLGEERIIRVRGPHDLPTRTTTDGQQASGLRDLPPIEFRQSPREDSQTIWEAFVDYWGAECWYCGQEKQRDRRELQLDHIEPNKRDGSNDDCWNRALACVSCNSDKSDRLTVAQTMDMALEAKRIGTLARRHEQMEAFERRHQWAKERWEEIRRG